MVKLKNIKNIHKRFIWFLIALFCFTLLYLPVWKVKADDTIIYDDQIRILEIEPGNQFLLGSNTTQIGDLPATMSNGKSVVITHITMAQFISMVDEIDGKYDVIILGRKNNNLKAEYSKGTAYRDYTNPFSQQISYLPLSTWSLSSHWQKNYTNYINSSNNIDDIKFAEYYSENDITKKRSDEILAMIKKNQLVYMDDKINSEDIKYTKLYSLYNQSQGLNLAKTSQSMLTLDNVVKGYIGLNPELKRPRVSKVTKPLDDKNSAESTRKMKYTVNVNEGKSEKLRLKLYLDINADGLFKDNELVETYDFQTSSDASTDFTFTHDLDRNFIGYLDWKIEIARENGIKTNLLGSSQYKSLIGPKKIRVLQITPDDSNLIDLSKNQLVYDSKVKNDYNIVINSKRVSDVNTDSKNGRFKLNGNYDMVIVGFADSYGFKQLYPEAIDEIESFIRTGQSVMFTHDTITPALANDIRPETGQTSTGPKDLTQRLRDYVGQARYIDPYRLKLGQNSTDIYKQEEITRDTSGNITNVLLKDKTIPHDYFWGNGNINSLNTNGLQVNTSYDYYKANDKTGNTQTPYSLGTTLQGHVVPATNYPWDWNNSWNYITQVKKVNSAQINKYPFELGNTINVATTHTQWYQLNLEDPDVVPWFNLSASDIDVGDARNYYYTYSKGNITYSGTGHSGGFQTDEQQLFINTMIKAERGANHAPTINSSIPLENIDINPQINEVPAGKDYYFSIDAEDYEKDVVNMHITINGQELNNNNIVSTINLSEMNSKKTFNIQTSNSNRTSIKFKIPLEQLQEALGNVNIAVEAEDTQGAKSSKNYVLKPVKSTSSIDTDFISALPNPSYLNGSIDVKYKITPNDYYYNSTLSSQGPMDEAVFLVDISQSMKSYNRFSELQNGITKQILNDAELNKIKLGVIGYGSSVYIGNRDNINDPKSCIMETSDENLTGIQKPLYNIYDANEKDGYRQFYQGGYVYDKISSNNQRQFGTALKLADSILTKYGEVNAKKALVIISAGDLTYSDEIEKIRSKGYKIITLDISNSTNVNIKDTHVKLGGYVSEKDGDYYRGTFNDNSNYNSVGDDMLNVANSLKKGIRKTTIINSAKLNFNLGTNFQMINNMCADGKTQIINTGNGYTIDLLSNINYTATTEKDSQGRTRYVANPFEITFKIKAANKLYGNLGFSGLVFDNQNFENNKLAILGTDLATDNNFIYSDVFGQKTKKIFTPVVKVIPNINYNHGLYQGMDSVNGKPIIDESERTFSKGATVTFGAYVDGALNNRPIQIKFDSKLNYQNIDLSKIRVFTIDGGKLNELSNDGSFVNGIYTYTPSGLLDSGGKILILYTEKVPENPNTYINTLKVMDMPDKYAKITVADRKLPDLF